MATPYFAKLQRALHIIVKLQAFSHSLIFPISISKPDLNSTVSLSSYTIIFHQPPHQLLVIYQRLIYLFLQKALIFSTLCRLPSLCILNQNILPLLPQFMNLIHNSPIWHTVEIRISCFCAGSFILPRLPPSHPFLFHPIKSLLVYDCLVIFY